MKKPWLKNQILVKQNMAFKEIINNLKKKLTIRGLTIFSKTELVIYSLIFIFLVTAVLIFYFNIAAEQRDEERRNDLVILERALSNYFKEHNAYPRMAEWQCIEQDVLKKGTFSQRIGDYLEEIPRDPLFRDGEQEPEFCYHYKSANDEEEYKIYARLERGRGKEVTEVFSFGGGKIYTGVYEETPWFDSDWKYRKEIVIDKSQIRSDLEDFPLLVDLKDEDIKDKSRRQGKDIIFVDKDNKKLKREIESYDNLTGELVAWIRMPFLSAEEDTRFYVYYGNPETIEEESRAVWDDHYLIVHHFEELFGTSYDSTVKRINGKVFGDIEQGVEGKIAGAFNFDGDDDYISLGLPEQLLNLPALTLSFWVYPTEIQEGVGIIGWEGTEYGPWQFLVDNQNNFFRARIGGTIYEIKAGKPFDWENWNYLTITYNGARLRYYSDGREITSRSVKQGLLEKGSGDFITIGRYRGEPWYSGSDIIRTYSFKGILDELRISDVARSTGWIRTSFENQNNPLSFIKTTGIQELF